MQKKCPCNSDLPYTECCKKLHDGVLAPSALALMRSRYSAYALGLVHYIIDTTHKNNPSYSPQISLWKKELKSFCASTQFLRLEIVHAEERDNHGEVSFIAHLKQEGQDIQLIEHSFFKKEGKKWLYLRGNLYHQALDLPHYQN